MSLTSRWNSWPLWGLWPFSRKNSLLPCRCVRFEPCTVPRPPGPSGWTRWRRSRPPPWSVGPMGWRPHQQTADLAARFQGFMLDFFLFYFLRCFYFIFGDSQLVPECLHCLLFLHLLSFDSLCSQMFSVFRSLWEPNVRRMDPVLPGADDMAEYRFPSERRRQRGRGGGAGGWRLAMGAEE